MRPPPNTPFIYVKETLVPNSRTKVLTVAPALRNSSVPGAGPSMVYLSHIQFDKANFFAPNQVIRCDLQYSDEATSVFYHPGSVHSYIDAALDIAAAYAKLEVLIGLAVPATKNMKAYSAAVAAMAAQVGKRGLIDIPGHIQDAFHTLWDANRFPHDGFYQDGTSNLEILGRIQETDIHRSWA